MVGETVGTVQVAPFGDSDTVEDIEKMCQSEQSGAYCVTFTVVTVSTVTVSVVLYTCIFVGGKALCTRLVVRSSSAQFAFCRRHLTCCSSASASVAQFLMNRVKIGIGGRDDATRSWQRERGVACVASRVEQDCCLLRDLLQLHL